MGSKLEAIPLVDIDEDGVFKYILIKVHTQHDQFKYIVRGYDRHEYHGRLFYSLLIYKINYKCIFNMFMLHK